MLFQDTFSRISAACRGRINIFMQLLKDNLFRSFISHCLLSTMIFIKYRYIVDDAVDLIYRLLVAIPSITHG